MHLGRFVLSRFCSSISCIPNVSVPKFNSIICIFHNVTLWQQDQRYLTLSEIVSVHPPGLTDKSSGKSMFDEESSRYCIQPASTLDRSRYFSYSTVSIAFIHGEAPQATLPFLFCARNCLPSAVFHVDRVISSHSCASRCLNEQPTRQHDNRETNFNNVREWFNWERRWSVQSVISSKEISV